MNPRLPPEIDELIYSFLSCKNLFNIMRASKRNHAIATSPLLWKTLIQRDFFVISNNNHQTSYKDLKLGLAREKASFILYMTAFSLIDLQIEFREQNGEFKKGLWGERGAFYNKEKAHKKLLRKLDQRVLHSLQALETFCQKLAESVPKNKLLEIKHFYNDCFNILISGQFNFNFKMLSAEINDEAKMQSMLFYLGMQALFKLDASISVGIICHKMELTKISPLLMEAFTLPCVKVIKKILPLNINLNDKFWQRKEYERIHTTPLMAAVLCMLDIKHINSSQEIITLLLQNGADTQVTVFFTEDDINTQEEYDKGAETIRNVCQWFLENRAESFESAEDKALFRQTMEKIINYQVIARPICK